MLKRITVLVLLCLVVFSGASLAAANQLKVLIWSNYYDPGIFDSFEKAYNCDVVITHHDTYEEAMKHIQAKTHDLIITGELIFPTLIQDGLLEPLDKSKIPNFKNLDPLFKGLAFDKDNKYTMPYHYIYVGLIYRKGKVNPAEVTLKNYFEAPAKFKGRLTSFPNDRIMIGMAMKYMGQSLNNLDKNNLALAKQLLTNLKSNLSTKGKSLERGILDPYFEIMNGEADIAISYAAQSTRRVLKAEDKVGIVLPKEGAIIGTDDMAVLKSAKNKDMAFKFINYLYTPQVAARSINYLGNPFPVLGVKSLIKPELANNPEIYPPAEVVKNLEFFIPMNDQQIAVYAKLWKEVFGGK